MRFGALEGRRSALIAVSIVVGLVFGCGSRTDLSGFDAGTRPVDARPPECARDADCDDGVPCTNDTCEGGRCIARADDARCDDGLFCSGPGRCDPAAGCVFGERVPCGDALECTDDPCNERLSSCDPPVPVSSRCPLSHRCDPSIGCVARALVHDRTSLYEIDLPSGLSHLIGRVELSLTDIALHPDGTTYGITSTSLYEIDETDGGARFISPLTETSLALDVHPDGDLVAAGLERVVRIDRTTGVSSLIARFPSGLSASGDIAFVDGRMLVTATRLPGTAAGPPDELMEVLLDEGEIVSLGNVGFPCIWALAPFGETLYGFTCRGELLEIHPRVGTGRFLAELDVLRIGGAAAR